MIDRYGIPLIVGFAPHEIEWLKAAGSLRGFERLQALEQICEMSGRKYASCERQMKALVAAEKREARAFLESVSKATGTASRTVFVMAPTLPRCKHKLPPSALRAISMAALTGGSARTVKARAAE